MFETCTEDFAMVLFAREARKCDTDNMDLGYVDSYTMWSEAKASCGEATDALP